MTTPTVLDPIKVRVISQVWNGNRHVLADFDITINAVALTRRLGGKAFHNRKGTSKIGDGAITVQYVQTIGECDAVVGDK